MRQLSEYSANSTRLYDATSRIMAPTIPANVFIVRRRRHQASTGFREVAGRTNPVNGFEEQ